MGGVPLIYFVPARKGSERCKNKNLREVFGLPLIKWTFSALSKVIESKPGKVLVSTDDDTIKAMAEMRGFQVQVRPAELCTSKATMSDVLFHHLPDFGDDEVCVLYPTNPLRMPRHILDAIAVWEALRAKDKTLMSVSPVMHRPYGLMSLSKEGELVCNSVLGEKFYQAQGMPEMYRANGAIYIFPSEMLKEKKINSQLFCEKTIPYIMPEPFGFEVDEEIDLKLAEVLMLHYADADISSTNSTGAENARYVMTGG